MTFVLIVGIILENLFLWFYGFLAFKFGWTEDYNFLAAYFSNFIVSIIYNGVLVYPVFLYFNFVVIIICFCPTQIQLKTLEQLKVTETKTVAVGQKIVLDF